MMEKNPKVSIIIRTFNEEKHIETLLKEINRQSYRNFEIIIVDSGSTDKTIEIAKKYDVRFVYIKPEEFTFGFSLNKGCEIARGDYLVFLSAHVYPNTKEWLQNLIKPFKDENIALCYGKQVGSKETKYSEKMLFLKVFPAKSFYEDKNPFCNNANCAIRKILWEEKKYDETLTGLEDLEWANWAVFEGYRTAYVAEAEITHIHEETYKQIYNRYKREAIALKSIFPHTHLSIFKTLGLLILNIIVDLLSALKNRCFFKSFFSIFAFRFKQYAGTYIGLKKKDRITKYMIQQYYYPRNILKKIIKK